MSRRPIYYSEQRSTPEANRDSNTPHRDLFRRLPHSGSVPRPDDGIFTPIPTSTIYAKEHRPISRSSAYGSVDEREIPEARASGYSQRLGPPQEHDRMDLDMPPPPPRPVSYGNLDPLGIRDRGVSQLPRTPLNYQGTYPVSPTHMDYPLARPAPTSAPRSKFPELHTRPQSSSSNHPWETSYQFSQDRLDYTEEKRHVRGSITVSGPEGHERRTKTYRGGRDEFEGPTQLLGKPQKRPETREGDLPPLPTHLDQQEQDHILSQVNQRLSQCAFDFVALWRFPIPMEPPKPAVEAASDKEWPEWAHLLKRLATKRKIPSAAVWNCQIKELTTVLDNALEIRHPTKPQLKPLKDDRNVLQFISAGIQVGKMLKDAPTMEFLDKLYRQTEHIIQERKAK